ncbi:MAG: CoA-transferase subunit beta [Solirubrobacteraceae bacterium]
MSSSSTRTDDVAPATTGELQTIVAARRLTTAKVVFIGVGKPSTAAILASEVHNPDLVLVYESGTIGARPRRVPLSIGDGELAETADLVVAVPEMFNYWVQPGRIDVAFLGAAQVDRFANLNSTVIGDYATPRTRLPGAGGAPEIASGCGEVIVIAPHDRRTLVERLDFVTTVGYADPDGSLGSISGAPPEGITREGLGLRGRGPTAVITDLGVLEPDPDTHELTLVQLHPGATVEQAREATGWSLRAVDDPAVTPQPTARELQALRELVAR